MVVDQFNSKVFNVVKCAQYTGLCCYCKIILFWHPEVYCRSNSGHLLLCSPKCLSGNTLPRLHGENDRNWPQKSKETSVILERNVTFLCSWLSPVFQSASYQEVLHNGSKLPETQSQTFGTEVGADRGNCVSSHSITFAFTLRFNDK